jgi:hypothetical protein
MPARRFPRPWFVEDRRFLLGASFVVLAQRKCSLRSRQEHDWRVTNVGPLGLWASGGPRALGARCGKIDKFLIIPHELTARSRQDETSFI